MLATACDRGATFSRTFRQIGPIPVGEHPNALIAADLDGDGDNDLAIPGVLGNDLTILRNDGGGTFTPLPPLPVPGGPLAAAAGDFDEDGRLDLALSLPTGQALRLLRGTADLSFPLLAELPVDQPGWVTAGDINGDGHLDLVVARFEPGGVTVLPGDGQGGFGAALPIADGPAGCSSLALGDLDGDGDLDVAATGANADSLVVLLNDGAGALAAGPAVDTGSWPSAVVIANVDDDATPEIIGTANLGNTVFVIDVTAGPPLALTSRSTLPTGAGPIAVAVGDLDGDGRADLVVTEKFQNTLSLVWNGPDGLGVAPTTTLATGDGPTPVAIADLDGAGGLDVAVADGFSSDVMLYLSR